MKLDVFWTLLLENDENLSVIIWRKASREKRTEDKAHRIVVYLKIV
jgi:hypothetical protein